MQLTFCVLGNIVLQPLAKMPGAKKEKKKKTRNYKKKYAGVAQIEARNTKQMFRLS